MCNASQTSDTPNGLLARPPTAGLAADTATAPEGHLCGPIPSRRLCPSPRCLHASVCVLPPGRGLCTASQLRPWDGSWVEPPSLQPRQCLREGRGVLGKTKLESINPPYCWGCWQGAILPNSFCCLGEALQHGPVVPALGLLRATSAPTAHADFAAPHLGDASMRILKCSQAVKTCPGLGVPLGTAGHGEAGNKPTGRESHWQHTHPRASQSSSSSIAATAGAVLGLRHAAPSPHAGEKPLQQCQCRLWRLEKGLLEAPNFRGSL